VYRLRRSQGGQVVVGVATVCLVLAAIIRIDIGGVNAPSLRELAPRSLLTRTAIPFCIALAVVSMRAGTHDWVEHGLART